METVGRLIAEKAPEKSPSPIVLNLYWTLYTGVLAFWVGDSSPNQEGTLAVLDHSLRAFVGLLADSA